MKPSQNTSWEKSGKWYNKLVGEKGHYYHQQVILPKLLDLLSLDAKSNVLDIGCGQGIFARQLPKDVSYTGLDLAKNLIASAKQKDTNTNHSYVVADATSQWELPDRSFTHAVAILSLQNMESPDNAITQVAKHLKKDGRFIMVLNHPMFRIPRQTGWGIDEKTKNQYRFINKYLSFMKIPITMHPGEENSTLTWSFHYSLSVYTHFLNKAGFVIEVIEEWESDKESVGKAARMENRARSEIPLFMTIVARKLIA